MLRRPAEFENGMTVAELKAIVANWSEVDENGNPCEVWVSDGNGLSSQVREASSLSPRMSKDGSLVWADLVLSHGVKTKGFMEKCIRAFRSARLENKMYYVGIDQGVISTSSDRPEMDRLLFTAYPDGKRVLSTMGQGLAESLGVIDAFR